MLFFFKNKMRLLYATSIRFPSPLANRIQIVSMAEAFSKNLHGEFTLGISENLNNQEIKSNVFLVGKNTSSFKLSIKLNAYFRSIKYILKISDLAN